MSNNARSSSGIIKDFRILPHSVKGVLDAKILYTNNIHIDEELFGQLDFISEIESQGIKHIKSSYKGKFPKKEHHKIFKNYIRQAKSYYKSARQLDYRVSPLNYYYSFLNLAKAYISLKDPNIVNNKRIGHGLSYVFPSGNKFINEKIKVEKGVFSIMYEQMFDGKTIRPNTCLNIINLLGYASDVGYEYDAAGFSGRSKIVGEKSRLLADSQSNELWVILALDGFGNIINHKKSLHGFNTHFRQVTFSPKEQKEFFGLEPKHAQWLSFYESKVVFDLKNPFVLHQIQNEVSEKIKDILRVSPYSSENNFSLAAPLRSNNQISFSEALAIYSVIFYLSSLVRYNPSYIEKITDGPYQWLLKRFIESAPTTLLRYMVNLIYNDIFIYKLR